MTNVPQRRAVYPGSFDPPTNGHIDVIARVAKIVDKLTIGIGSNSRKHGLFSVAERLELMRQCCSHLGNVDVKLFSGLAVEFARTEGATLIVRGVRSEADLSYELPMAHTNRALAPELDVLFIPTAVEQSYISSSLVREIAASKGEVSPFVPKAVAEALSHKF